MLQVHDRSGWGAILADADGALALARGRLHPAQEGFVLDMSEAHRFIGPGNYVELHVLIVPDVAGPPYVPSVSHHWKPSRALTRTRTGYLMHDGRRLIARIEPVFLRHRRALQATDPNGVHLTYGPDRDIDFIATAVWTMWERATALTPQDEGRS